VLTNYSYLFFTIYVYTWDPEFQYESTPIVERNNMGEPIVPIEQSLEEEVLDI
jgi:hypothetical protein